MSLTLSVWTCVSREVQDVGWTTTTSWVNQHVLFFFNSTFMDLSVLKMYLEHPVLGFWQLSTPSSCWGCGGFSGQSAIKIKMYTVCCFCCSNWCTWWQYLTTWPQRLPLRPVQLLCKHCHNVLQDKLLLSETLQFPSHLDYSVAIGRFFNTSRVEDQSFKKHVFLLLHRFYSSPLYLQKSQNLHSFNCLQLYIQVIIIWSGNYDRERVALGHAFGLHISFCSQ